MTRELRYDRGRLRPKRRMADGRLRVDAWLTRSGVFVYHLPNGHEQREYRPETEVFRADSLETLREVAVTDDHPSQMLSPNNIWDLQRGLVVETPRRDGAHVAAALLITDRGLIEKMEGGKREVSCGYSCDIDTTPGVTSDGERYDAVQRNIQYNHVAVVSVGRAGTAHARMDGGVQRRDETGVIEEIRRLRPKFDIPEAKSAEFYEGMLREIRRYDAEFSTAQREKLAEKGEALQDGSYPIRNRGDLQNALQSFGRVGEGKRLALARHLMKRARALGLTDMLPDNGVLGELLKRVS